MCHSLQATCGVVALHLNTAAVASEGSREEQAAMSREAQACGDPCPLSELADSKDLSNGTRYSDIYLHGWSPVSAGVLSGIRSCGKAH